MLEERNRSSLKNTVLRKSLHVAMCTFLFLPYIINSDYINKLIYYSVLLVVAAEINSLILKKPLISVKLRENFEKRRRSLLESLHRSSALREVLDMEAKLENIIQDQIRQIEREYERKGGYIGIVYALVGVTISQTFFGNNTLYGILALTIVDPITAMVGSIYGRRIPYTNGSIEGSIIALAIFYLSLITLGFRPEKAFFTSIVACITELFSSEDNLTLPLTTSFIVTLLSHP